MDPTTQTTLGAFFTTESLLSLQGAAAAALLVPAGLLFLIGGKFQPYAKWVSFAIALILAYVVAILAVENTSFLKWVLAFFNGFLTFGSAVGINQMGAKQGGNLLGPTDKRLFKDWL
jgi:hypothetical protein